MEKTTDFDFIEKVLAPYNPWWKDANYQSGESFRRPIFSRLLSDLREIKQVLSVTGPRRVGKTTLIKQLIETIFFYQL